MLPAETAINDADDQAAAVVLYDGDCGMCAGVVKFVLPRDGQGRFRFAALQGDYAARALAAHGRDASKLDTFFVLVAPGSARERLLDRSTAALYLAGGLGGAWRLLAALRVIPRPLRDVAYRLVARYRYRLFGRTDACLMPAPGHAKRFLA